MSEPLELRTLGHLNAIVDGYEATLDHFVNTLGATLNFDIPDDGEVKPCLVCLGGVIFELFAPHDRNAERGQGKLLGRFGDHYIGVEYVVDDVEVARQRCAELEIRIISDLGSYFLTYPGGFHGISWELALTDWQAGLSAGGTLMNERTTQLRSREFWRDEHPMSLTGLVRISAAVEDLDAAVGDFARVVGATELYRAERPAAGATAVGLRLADIVVELLAPTGPGRVRDYLDRYGERIRSTVFGTTGLAKVKAHLASAGIELIEGDAPDAMAISPEQNHNLWFEFSEEPTTHPWP